MNWPVFWTLLVGTSAGLAFCLGGVWLTIKLADLIGHKWAMSCFIVSMIVGLSAILGMVK